MNIIYNRAVVVVSNVDKKVILQEIVLQVDQEVVVMVDVIVMVGVIVIVIAVETVDVIVTEEDQDQDHKYFNFELIRFFVVIKCILKN